MDKILQKASQGKYIALQVAKYKQFFPEQIENNIVLMFHFRQYALTMSKDKTDKDIALHPEFIQIIESMALVKAQGNEKRAYELINKCKMSMGKEWMSLGLCKNDTCSF